ncbi:hypothetical protein FQN49_002106, partial [Arthroderma sp. PD_2]
MAETIPPDAGRSAHGVKEVTDDKENHHDDNVSLYSHAGSLQPGVAKAELLQKAWSKKSLAVAFSGLMLVSLVITFSDFAIIVYEPYATSSFRQHSLLSVARVVGNITRICAYPIIAKLSDAFGRAEMFTFSIGVQTLAFVIYASSQNIRQYVSAGIFDSVGGTGFALTQQVFVADATNLVDRAFWPTLPESLTTIPALYLGTLIGDKVLAHSSWRWGWGMWAIILPPAALPLILTMVILQRRAAKHGLASKGLSAITGERQKVSMWQRTWNLMWVQLDLLGAFLLVAGLSLFLVPLSLTGARNPGLWKEAHFIA